MVNTDILSRRKGVKKHSEIPDEVLVGLNRGQFATVDLTEWLAIDMSVLLQTLLTQMELEDKQAELELTIKRLSEEGIMQWIVGIGSALQNLLKEHPKRVSLFRILSRQTGLSTILCAKAKQKPRFFAHEPGVRHR